MLTCNIGQLIHYDAQKSIEAQQCTFKNLRENRLFSGTLIFCLVIFDKLSQ